MTFRYVLNFLDKNSDWIWKKHDENPKRQQKHDEIWKIRIFSEKNGVNCKLVDFLN